MMNRFKKLLSLLCIISLLVTGTMMAFAEDEEPIMETPIYEEVSVTEEAPAEEDYSDRDDTPDLTGDSIQEEDTFDTDEIIPVEDPTPSAEEHTDDPAGEPENNDPEAEQTASGPEDDDASSQDEEEDLPSQDGGENIPSQSLEEEPSSPDVQEDVTLQEGVEDTAPQQDGTFKQKKCTLRLF